MENGTLVGKTREDVNKYYKKEYDRVCTEIEKAQSKLSGLRAGILTLERAAKIKELEFAIGVGKIYRDKIKAKC